MLVTLAVNVPGRGVRARDHRAGPAVRAAGARGSRERAADNCDTEKGCMSSVAGSFSAPGGRRRITSRAELEQVAFGLFERQGFEGTTVGGHRPRGRDRAAHVLPVLRLQERRALGRIRGAAGADARPPGGLPAADPLAEAIRLGVITFHEAGPGGASRTAWQRRRLELILRVPALQAHSTLRLRRLAAGDRGVRGRADRAAARLAAPGHAGPRGRRGCPWRPASSGWPARTPTWPGSSTPRSAGCAGAFAVT